MQSKHVPEHRIREAVNPRTGRRERVFVDLDAVYPDIANPGNELSFEELRAMSRGWMSKNWRAQKEPLRQITGNEQQVDPGLDRDFSDQFHHKLTVKDVDSHAAEHDAVMEKKSKKAQKLKLREVKGETQTGKSQPSMRTRLRTPRCWSHPTDSIHSQDEVRLPNEEQQVAPQKHPRANDDHAHPRCHG